MKLEVREVNGSLRLDLTGQNAHEWGQLRAFIEKLNGGPVRFEDGCHHAAFDRALRVESVGFDVDGSVDSIAIVDDT